MAVQIQPFNFSPFMSAPSGGNPLGGIAQMAVAMKLRESAAERATAQRREEMLEERNYRRKLIEDERAYRESVAEQRALAEAGLAQRQQMASLDAMRMVREYAADPQRSPVVTSGSKLHEIVAPGTDPSEFEALLTTARPGLRDDAKALKAAMAPWTQPVRYTDSDRHLAMEEAILGELAQRYGGDAIDLREFEGITAQYDVGGLDEVTAKRQQQYQQLLSSNYPAAQLQGSPAQLFGSKVSGTTLSAGEALTAADGLDRFGSSMPIPAAAIREIVGTEGQNVRAALLDQLGESVAVDFGTSGGRPTGSFSLSSRDGSLDEGTLKSIAADLQSNPARTARLIGAAATGFDLQQKSSWEEIGLTVMKRQGGDGPAPPKDDAGTRWPSLGGGSGQPRGLNYAEILGLDEGFMGRSRRDE